MAALHGSSATHAPEVPGASLTVRLQHWSVAGLVLAALPDWQTGGRITQPRPRGGVLLNKAAVRANDLGSRFVTTCETL